MDEVQSFIDALSGGPKDEAQSNGNRSTNSSDQHASTQLAKITLSPRDRARIQELSKQADAYISASIFVGPGDKNAAAVYRKILEIDPNDRHAKDALTEIASIIAKAATVTYKADTRLMTSSP